jgi:serine/threonine protein kinase
MGEVYTAVDTRLDRTVAIKVLAPQLSEDPRFRERFDREARIISSLDHPHICPLFDVGDGFLVMPYLAGETLATRLSKGPLPIDQVLRYATQIADALDKAHRRGVIHRDLKPGNVMLTKDGAKLLDFGLAKYGQAGAHATAGISSVTAAPTAAAEPELTTHGAVLGTLPYMSPEQVEGAEADARSDVFAFGAMVYEMATGRRAFEGRSQAALMAMIIGHEPPPVSSSEPHATPLVDHLVKTCLAKDPDERWQTMADVLIQLRLIGALPVSSLAAARPSSRGTIIGAAAAVATFVAGTAAGWLASSPRTDPTPATFTFDVENVGFGVGAPLQFALSPDGAHLVSVAGSEKGSILSLRTFANQATQTLPGTDGAANPFWAPDSRSIGFFADGRLKTVDIFGAPPQSLADATRNAGGTWNHDGTIVFSTNAGPLVRVSATGGDATPLTALDESRSEIAHRFPSFLPDGQRFLYVAVSSLNQESIVYVGSLMSRERTRLLASGAKALVSPSGHVLFMRNDALMAQAFDVDRLALTGDPVTVVEPVGANIQNSAAGFTVSDTGVLAYRSRDARNRQLAVFDRTGAQVGTFGTVGFHSNPAASPDFSRVAVRDGSTDDIWIFDRSRGSTARFTFDRASDNAPVWSPDGQRVVFASNRSGVFDLYLKRTSEGGQEELLFQSQEPKTPEGWSADGRLLLYRTQGKTTNADLWMLRLDQGRTPEPVLTGPAEEREGQLSPDGKWIAFVSSEPGSLQVFVQAFPVAGPRWQVSTDGGHQPRWRGDGRELFFLSETRDAMAVPVAPSGTALEIGTPQRLFPTTAASFAERNSWEVAPDGQRFLVNSVPVQRAPITVVVNWLEGVAGAR